LPHLEIPELSPTCEKYVEAIKGLQGHPNIGTEDITRAERMMKDFAQNEVGCFM